MFGQVMMVTGATNGIGKVTARELAQQGTHVILVSRNRIKLENTVEEIKAETGNHNVSYIQADLSIMDDVRHLAEEFHKQYDRLDVLVNNAGAFFNDRQISKDGYEMTFALNHLNYFLLTNLLLDTLKKTAAETGESRIVNVSSDAHYSGKLNFDDLQSEQKYNGWNAYANSKLMNIVFTYELARRLEGTGVTANVLHPGFVNTGFGMNNGGFIAGILNLAQMFFARSGEDGAKTTLYLATQPDVKGVSGKYWADSAQKKSSTISYDVDVQKRLWEISAELIGLAQKVTG